MGVKDLTAKQKAFVREYLLCRNGVEAMKKAKYKSKNPDVDASALLKNPKIKAIVEAAEQKAEKDFEIKKEEILQELSDIAFGNIGDVLDWDDEHTLSLKPKEKMSKRGLTFIESIKIEKGVEKVHKENEAGEEEAQYEPYISDIKITTLGKEKVKALKLLGEHVGLWRPKDDGSGDKSTSREEARRASIQRLSEILRKTNK